MLLYPPPTDDQIANALNLQVLARIDSSKITIPKDWVPKTQLDKFVANNLGILDDS